MAQETKHVFSMALGYFIPTCTFTNCVHVTRDVSTEKVLNRKVENRKKILYMYSLLVYMPNIVFLTSLGRFPHTLSGWNGKNGFKIS